MVFSSGFFKVEVCNLLYLQILYIYISQICGVGNDPMNPTTAMILHTEKESMSQFGKWIQ